MDYDPNVMIRVLAPLDERPGLYSDVRIGLKTGFSQCGFCRRDFPKGEGCMHVGYARNAATDEYRRVPRSSDDWPLPPRTVPLDEFGRTQSVAATATKSTRRRRAGGDVIDEPTERTATSKENEEVDDGD